MGENFTASGWRKRDLWNKGNQRVTITQIAAVGRSAWCFSFLFHIFSPPNWNNMPKPNRKIYPPFFQVKVNKKWTNPLSDYLHKAFPQCTTQLSGWKEFIGTHQLIHQRNKCFCAQTTSKGNTCMVSAFHGDLSDQGWEFKNLPDLPRHLVILCCITNHLLQCSLSDWWFLASRSSLQSPLHSQLVVPQVALTTY